MKTNVEQLSKESFEIAYKSWIDANYDQFHNDNIQTLHKFCEIFKCSVSEPISFQYVKYDLKVNFHHWELTEEELYFIVNLNYESIHHIPVYGYLNNTRLTGSDMDDKILFPIVKFIQQVHHKSYYNLMNECVYTFFDECRKLYEEQNSKESFIEFCNDNNLLFTDRGERTL